jgi:hypothetical protein
VVGSRGIDIGRVKRSDNACPGEKRGFRLVNTDLRGNRVLAICKIDKLGDGLLLGCRVGRHGGVLIFAPAVDDEWLLWRERVEMRSCEAGYKCGRHRNKIVHSRSPRLEFILQFSDASIGLGASRCGQNDSAGASGIDSHHPSFGGTSYG